MVDCILNGTVLRTMDIAIEEMGNAVWKQVYQRSTLTREAGELAFENGVKILKSLEADATEDVSLEALGLAFTCELSFYDALYVAAASERNCPIATADKQLARKAAGFVEIIEVE